MSQEKLKLDFIGFSLKKQRTVFLLSLVLSGLYIIYALVYCTNLAPLRIFDDIDAPEMYVPGAELYNIVQPFNRMLLLLGFIQLGAVAATYIFFCQKRRIYYIGNYVSGILLFLVSAFWAVYNLIFNIIYMGKYSKIDFVVFREMADLYAQEYVKSSFFFAAGIILSLVSALLCALLAAILLGKYRQSKKEFIEKKLKEGADNAN